MWTLALVLVGSLGVAVLIAGPWLRERSRRYPAPDVMPPAWVNDRRSGHG